jgi:hypothetical protein
MKPDSSRLALPDAAAMTRQLGAGRAAFAAGILAAPVLSIRLLGVDTATAQRVTWLTRMMAVRDAALGVGTVLSARTGGATPWLVGGAVSDLVDAVVLAGALKQGRAKGLLARGTVLLAGGAAVTGALAAVRSGRS